MIVRLLLLFLIVALAAFPSASAFIASPATGRSQRTSILSAPPMSTTALSERKWNFNEGGSPWGLKKNAEVWNGRVAQVAFVLVVAQELIQGKGVVQGVQEGDPFNLVCLAAFGVSVVGLTGWLALKGDDDYVTRDLEN